MEDVDLPKFLFHPDPIASGSVERSERTCACCGQARGAIYVGPIYTEADVDDAICPWCIADGSAHRKLHATFVDAEVLDDAWPGDAATIIAARTPGFATWQGDAWPGCCGNATAFIGPMGIAELRKHNYEWEGSAMSHIVHEMQISGGAANRLLDSLNREHGPTAYVFQCLACGAPKFHIDQP